MFPAGAAAHGGNGKIEHVAALDDISAFRVA
jgi:hypothetical protein